MFANNHFILGHAAIEPRVVWHKTLNAKALADALLQRRAGPALVRLMEESNALVLLVNERRLAEFGIFCALPRHNSRMFLWAVHPDVFRRVLRYDDPVELVVGKRYQTRDGALVMIYAHDAEGSHGVFLDDGATGVWSSSGRYRYGDCQARSEADESFDLILCWDEAIRSIGAQDQQPAAGTRALVV